MNIRLSVEGMFVFLGCVAVTVFLSAQWFNIWFNTEPAAARNTNTNIAQEVSIASSCVERSRCSEYVAHRDQSLDVSIPVLMYHHIRYVRPFHNARERYFSISPERFEYQMRRLKEAGYTPITLELFWESLRMGSEVLPDRPVLLTFDDGHRNHFEDAVPILKKYDFPAVFFIYTDGMSLNGYMDEEMLHELAEDDRFDFGSHTESHTALTRLATGSRMSELENSKSTIETITGREINAFSYPYGAKNDVIEREVEDAGYDMAFRIGPGTHHAYKNRFRISRIQVLSWDDPARLIEKYSRR